MSYNTKWLRNNGPIPGPSTPPKPPEEELADTLAITRFLAILGLIFGLFGGGNLASSLFCGVSLWLAGISNYLHEKKIKEKVHGRKMPDLVFSSKRKSS